MHTHGSADRIFFSGSILYLLFRRSDRIHSLPFWQAHFHRDGSAAINCSRCRVHHNCNG
jgi:hypothetical protein